VAVLNVDARAEAEGSRASRAPVASDRRARMRKRPRGGPIKAIRAAQPGSVSRRERHTIGIERAARNGIVAEAAADLPEIAQTAGATRGVAGGFAVAERRRPSDDLLGGATDASKPDRVPRRRKENVRREGRIVDAHIGSRLVTISQSLPPSG
jgi:hypothetical protein